MSGRTPNPCAADATMAAPVGVTSSWEISVAVFARRRHRPQAFESGELLVSPAAIDLCGVLVTPRAEDFERLTARRTEAILDEVTLDASLLAEVVAAAGVRP